jgi:8-oxo-dGTP diphosphatase
MPDYKKVGVVIVVDGDKFLILQRSKAVRSGSGFWNFPGGSVEEGESIAMGAQRELKEEADLDADRGEMKYLGNIIRGDLKVHFFITKQFSGEVKINEESDDYKWITIDDLDKYLFVGGGKLDAGLVGEMKKYIGG